MPRSSNAAKTLKFEYTGWTVQYGTAASILIILKCFLGSKLFVRIGHCEPRASLEFKATRSCQTRFEIIPDLTNSISTEIIC